MNFSEEDLKVMRKALNKWGIELQVNMVFEEVGELLQALSCYKRSKFSKSDLAEEIADVYLMLKQIEIAFCIEESVKEAKEIKLQRLKERLEK